MLLVTRSFSPPLSKLTVLFHSTLVKYLKAPIRENKAIVSDSGQETAFVLTVMSVTVLVPSGWILANLENYKSHN
uniref:Cytochrome c oxidase subunit 8A, mitochondrial n=1 Tax=Monopterus albus TaxID=43700 RepID=A0A3Q3J962_MONAL